MVQNLCGFNPWVRKIPWRREWQPTQIFLPGKFHAQRSLAGSSPWGSKESDTTEQLKLSLLFPRVSDPETGKIVKAFMD